MTTSTMTQYITVAIIVATTIVFAIRFIVRLIKRPNNTSCPSCPLASSCNRQQPNENCDETIKRQKS